MGGLVDVDALVEQLMTDLSASGRTAYRPKEIIELVQKAAGEVLKDRRKHCLAYGPPLPCTNTVAGDVPRRGVRMPSGDRRG